jgi:hypothetical protein
MVSNPKCTNEWQRRDEAGLNVRSTELIDEGTERSIRSSSESDSM